MKRSPTCAGALPRRAGPPKNSSPTGRSRLNSAGTPAGQPPPQVSIPVGYTTFPGEIFRAPRSWVEQGYPTLTYFHEAAKGGHFAAWEEPGLFSEEIRAAFNSLR